jgi:hypothetical protein
MSIENNHKFTTTCHLLSGWWCAGKTHILNTLRKDFYNFAETLDVCSIYKFKNYKFEFDGKISDRYIWESNKLPVLLKYKFMSQFSLLKYYEHINKKCLSISTKSFKNTIKSNKRFLIVEVPPPFLFWWNNFSNSYGSFWLETDQFTRVKRISEITKLDKAAAFNLMDTQYKAVNLINGRLKNTVSITNLEMLLLHLGITFK